MRKIILYIVVISTTISLKAQCDFSPSGVGEFNSFDDYNLFEYWTTDGNGISYGQFSYNTTDMKQGSGCIQADIDTSHNWAVRMFNQACKIPLKEGYTYEVDFWVKANIDSRVRVWLYAGSSASHQGETILSIETPGWEKHKVSFSSEETNDGGIKFAFMDAGTYLLDGIAVIEKDCNGDINGSATLDICNVCSDGNTGITPDSYCDFTTITPDNPYLYYSGTLYEDINTTKAVLHRFSEEFLTVGSDGTWSESKAQTQSGVSIGFKTNSPVFSLNFSELIGAEQRADHFAIFKNGVLYEDNITSDDFTVTNFDLDMAEWTITLPSFDGMVFNSLEIVNGFDLNPIPQIEKPQYFAIGNSITHGVGQNDAGHLTYPFLIADSLGYEVHNLGIGGSRISPQILTNLNGQTADVITVLWGYNDVNNGIDLDNGPLSRYKELIDSLCKSQPQAKIYAILPTPTNTTIGSNNPGFNDNTIEQLRNEEEVILTSLQLTYSNLYIVNSHTYITKSTDLNDDVHLNVQGAYNLAMGLISEINENTITSVPLSLLKEIEIYPNPTTGIISFNNSTEYDIITIEGLVIKSGYGKGTNISGLSAGIYFIKTANGIVKVIKQ